MNRSDLEDCELIINSTCPQRSPLVGLEPIGMGTGYQESLGSYFLRLADTHSLSPQALLKFMKGHYPDEFPNMGKWTSSHFAHLTGINGRGSVARKVVKIIEELTNASFLSKLTLLPVAHCLSDQGLLTDKKRWCPQCFYDCMSAGGAYGLLLWQIKLVTVCPLHEIPLVSSCD